METAMPKTELNFTGNDPGAVKHGNFINYYSFQNTKERTAGLHPSMFPPVSEEPVICLDIGCNTGELTKEVYYCLKTAVYPKSDIKILGVDIDPILIERATELNDEPDISYISLDITSMEQQDLIKHFLRSNKKQIFDVIFCFSVTMWIHINNGDKGLQDFLKYITSSTRSLVIEPQPWKCYRNAQRRMKKAGGSFPLYETLKIRSNVNKIIEDILLKNNGTKVYESASSSWDRRIQSFHIPCSKKFT